MARQGYGVLKGHDSRRGPRASGRRNSEMFAEGFQEGTRQKIGWAVWLLQQWLARSASSKTTWGAVVSGAFRLATSASLAYRHGVGTGLRGKGVGAAQTDAVPRLVKRSGSLWRRVAATGRP